MLHIIEVWFNICQTWAGEYAVEIAKKFDLLQSCSISNKESKEDI